LASDAHHGFLRRSSPISSTSDSGCVDRLMGTPINTPLTSEIWHLTIDDLLEPVAAAPCLGGPGPFVINLSASTAPISVPMKAVADHPGTHLYQIQRTEDRRVRYRLRLGPFETESQAEALLPMVREIYPSAFTAGAEAEDARAIESIKTKIEAQQLAAVKAAMSKAAPAALPNAARFTAPRAAPAEPARDTPATPADVDGGALPASPPAAWLALQTPSTVPEVHSLELDFPPPKPDAGVKAAVRELAASTPVFAPARWSASARAFVPNAGFEPPTRAPVPVSPTPRAAATAVPVGPAVPELAVPAAPTVPTAPVAAVAPTSPPARTVLSAPNAPIAFAAPTAPTVLTMPPKMSVAAVPADSLIPVLSDSMAVLRPSAPARVSATAAAPMLAAPVAATSARVPVTPAPVAAALGAAAATPGPAAAVAPVRAATAIAPALSAPPPVATTPAPTPARAAATAAAPLETPAAASGPATDPWTTAAAVAAAIGKENRFMPPPPPPRRSEALATPLSSLDTTQTLRPLTPKELEDASVLRWFVIQLSCSEEAFDPDSLPHLDIFTEYRLYSVSGLEQGKLVHVLRLGFFSEESHAKAVAGYLGSFYASPVIKRVSAAERTRFAQHRVEARKDIGATGMHAVIEITDQRVIRPKRPGNPPAPPASPTPPSARAR
jgi:hypothetical protein